jgi:alpha-pyrone synthase
LKKQTHEYNAYLTAIGTAVPQYAVSQMQIADFMAEALLLDERDRRRLTALYRQTRIEKRHSVLADYNHPNGSFTFYPNTPGLEPFPTISQRMLAYRQEAVPLAQQAVENCLAEYPNFDRQQITHLIVVSCTGLYAPGPDIELIEGLGLPTTTQRLAINFMGCYGAFNGLKTADAIVRADPDSKVLVVCVELCTLHFQKKTETDHLLSNALFADGAAAVLVESEARGAMAFRLQSFYSDLFPEGKAAMAWHVSDFGFEMTLTSDVPRYIQQGIGDLLSRLLERSGLTIGDIDHYAMHPGGRRILEVIEQQLGIDAEDNRFAYEVLRQYGNMSSATVLFVLKEIWQANAPLKEGGGHILSCAFGPGLTLESMILEMTLQPAELLATSSEYSTDTVPIG